MYDLRTASDDGVLMSFGILETFISLKKASELNYKIVFIFKCCFIGFNYFYLFMNFS